MIPGVQEERVHPQRTVSPGLRAAESFRDGMQPTSTPTCPSSLLCFLLDKAAAVSPQPPRLCWGAEGRVSESFLCHCWPLCTCHPKGSVPRRRPHVAASSTASHVQCPAHGSGLEFDIPSPISSRSDVLQPHISSSANGEQTRIPRDLDQQPPARGPSGNGFSPRPEEIGP